MTDLPSKDSTEETLPQRIDRYLRQLAPHMREREGMLLLGVAQASIASKQAEVDNWINTSKSQSANYAALTLSYKSKQAELAAANEHIRKLKSDLEDSNAMNLPGTQQCIYTDVSNALKQANATIAALQAKIADAQLLAVIEQMREALIVASHSCVYSSKKQILAAIALTPDLSALKEHDARVLEKAADWFNADEQDAWEVAAELNRMASELRKT